MRLVEATSQDRIILAGRGDEKTGSTANVSEGTAGQFASVLRATRRSSTRLMDLLMPRTDVAAAGGRESRQEKREAASELSKNDPPAERPDEPSRADKLEALHRRHEAKTRGRAEVSQPAETPVEIDATSAHSSRPVSVIESATPQPSWLGGIIATPQGTALTAPTANVAPTDGRLTNEANAGSFVGPTAAPASSGTASTNVETASAGSATAPLAPGSAATASERADAVKELAAAATGRANASVRSGGSASEFQSLLQTLGRSRGTESQSATGAAGGRTVAEKAGSDQPIDVRSTESLRELARIVQTRIGQRNSSMTLLLSPAELGRLRIEVRMVDDAVEVRFQAETPEGLEAIRSRLDELKGVLEQQGLQIDRIEVELTLSPAPPNPDREWSGQQPSDPGWSAPTDDGRSAGHARQSFGDGRDGGTGRSMTEEFPVAASSVLPEVILDYSELTGAVDIMA